MDKLVKLHSAVIPWIMPNIDTDIITPMKRMLKNSSNLSNYAFEPYRFIDGDGDSGILNPEFPLNKPEYKGAQIMLVGENFGSGSSRETAPMAIAAMGIRCLIGESFGSIFFKNCFQQGILPITLSAESIGELAALNWYEQVTVDLSKKIIITPRHKTISFKIEALRQASLMEGLDDVGMTIRKINKIKQFNETDQQYRPWVYMPIQLSE